MNRGKVFLKNTFLEFWCNFKLVLAVFCVCGWALFAGAVENPSSFNCRDRSSANVVQISSIRNVGAEQDGVQRVVADMLVQKLNGSTSSIRVRLNGTREMSARGAYYDLRGPSGYSAFIDAVTQNGEPSRFQVNSVRLDLYCLESN